MEFFLRIRFSTEYQKITGQRIWEGDWSNFLTTLVPSFFRCFWCSSYFEVSKEFTSTKKHQYSDFRCCLFCATNLGDEYETTHLNQKKWHHCPICYKFILVKSSQYLAFHGNYIQLDIHIQHCCEEQRNSLRYSHRQKTLAHTKPKCYQDFSLASWYPDSIDCEFLFWNQYHIK